MARGRNVRVLLLADPARIAGDARTSLEAWRASGGAEECITNQDLPALGRALVESDVIIDAVFGTGLTRDVAGLEKGAIEQMNAAPHPRVALDLPSGLDADRGVPLGLAVRATSTLTFAAKKRGLCIPLGAEHAGSVRVIDIGIPQEAVLRMGEAAVEVEDTDVLPLITPRTRLSHKGTSGRVLVVAGSPGKIGAALLVARGALRAGAGLVTIAAVPEAAQALETRVLEAMTARIDPARPESSLAALLGGADAAVVGPGIGFGETSSRAVDHAVLAFDGKLVVDADAITHFRDRARELLRVGGRLLLTPHPGELGRLLGIATADVEADRFGSLARAVAVTGACVLLKGAPTLVGAPGERVAVCPAGHAVLATGGTGDVLSGCIAALLVDNDPYRAALAGAFVHGRAAERLAASRGVDRGVLAHEVADELPAAIAGLSRERRFVPG
jgi:NAD(P)H-hydrate epimerase